MGNRRGKIRQISDDGNGNSIEGWFLGMNVGYGMDYGYWALDMGYVWNDLGRG